MFAEGIVTGRLVKDPEKKGDSMVVYDIAVNRYDYREKGQTTDYYHVLRFGKGADNDLNNLVKGSVVTVGGELRLNKFKRKDGSKGMSAEINANNVGYIHNYGKNAESEGNNEKYQSNEGKQTSQVETETEIDSKVPGVPF